MERGNKDEILNMIQEIEKKNSEIDKYLSKLSILSRNETLKNIMNNIIKSSHEYRLTDKYTEFEVVAPGSFNCTFKTV